MATVPSDQKFHTIAANVVTKERGSSLVNSQKEIFTMQDVTDTVAAGLPPTPPPVNPGSGFYPINKDGVFVDSGLSNTVSVLPPFITGGSLGLKFYDDFSSKTLLALDPLNAAYTFGDASFIPGIGVSADAGISIQPAIGEMIMGCGISSPTNGVFRANGAQGFVYIGTSSAVSIGVRTAGGPALRIGSALMGGSPVDSVTPVVWTKVRNEAGTLYYSPLYQ